jgi:hypothetical protein
VDWLIGLAGEVSELRSRVVELITKSVRSSLVPFVFGCDHSGPSKETLYELMQRLTGEGDRLKARIRELTSAVSSKIESALETVAKMA